MTDYTVEDTIYLMFTTRAFATGIPTTLAGTPVVSAYENDSLTQITAGITLGVDHDSVTGMNLLTIVATAANGYESGKDYNMVITTGTVGGVSVVGEVVGTFSLGRSAAAVDLANGTDGLGAIKADTAAILVDTGTDGVVLANDAITAAKIAADAIGASEIAANAIGASELATDAVEEIADQVWDELLTGGTHNIATSAGRRLRALQDFGLYEGGAVWIDTVAGTPGTVDFENGTVTNPVNTIADAKTIADSLLLKRFQIIAGSTVTLAATFDNYAFTSDDGWTLALGGQSVNNTSITGATVSGIFTGNPHFTQCQLGAITGPSALIGRCGITGTITANNAGDWVFHHCWSQVAGTGTPAFDFGAAALNTNLNFRDYSGGLEIQNMGGGGTDTMSFEGRGQLVINANCSAGTVAIRGMFTVTDNAGGALTLSDDARIDVAQINAEVDSALDTAIPGSPTADSINERVAAIDDLTQASGGGDLAAIKAKTDNLPSGVAKNVALSNFPFLMVDATDFATPETGLTITGEISQDGAAFGALTNAEVEVGNGVYTIDLTQAEMNADTITLKFTAAGAAQRVIVLKTDA